MINIFLMHQNAIRRTHRNDYIYINSSQKLEDHLIFLKKTDKIQAVVTSLKMNEI